MRVLYMKAKENIKFTFLLKQIMLNECGLRTLSSGYLFRSFAENADRSYVNFFVAFYSSNISS